MTTLDDFFSKGIDIPKGILLLGTLIAINEDELARELAAWLKRMPSSNVALDLYDAILALDVDTDIRDRDVILVLREAVNEYLMPDPQ